MFVKVITKKVKDTLYYSHRLVESYKNANNQSRHRTILDLGTLTIPSSEWKILANRVEDIVQGREVTIFPPEEHIEKLAKKYAALIQKEMLNNALAEEKIKGTTPEKIEKPEIIRMVDNSLEHLDARTIGGEYICYEMIKKLGLPEILKDIGLNAEQIKMSVLTIVGRLINPASENATRFWAREESGIDELLGTDFRYLSNNALYRTSDLLVGHKEKIESKLKENEKKLFGLNETIILYDLTNTYFEGNGRGSDKLKRGHSKEKRTDCPLITLGLIIDELGFPKYSKVFEGGISEPGTFETFLDEISKDETALTLLGKDKTIIMDAGIATEGTIEKIKAKGYKYVVMSRKKEFTIEELTAMNIEDKKIEIKEGVSAAKIVKSDGEIILFCESEGRKQKELSMKNSFEKRFEGELTKLKIGLTKKSCMKKEEKIREKIGRLREKYSLIAGHYEVKITSQDGLVTELSWNVKDVNQLDNKFSGTYYMKTNRADLTEKEIWKLYVSLTKVESAFRFLKSNLGLRPVFHEKEERIEGHLFISVLAYHVLISIQNQLRIAKINHDWSYIVKAMKQERITSAYMTESGLKIYEKKCVNATEFQEQVYKALELKNNPLARKKATSLEL